VPTSSSVKFFYEVSGFSLRNRTDLRCFIAQLFKNEGYVLDSLNYIFCSDKRLLKINRDYLKHDYYTDIITFDLSAGPAITGEIYISRDRVRENAKTLGTSFKSELHRVIFHGALHLCGYGDNTAAQRKIMREKEDFLIGQYFN
jgi:probable rRNA maturation factor